MDHTEVGLRAVIRALTDVVAPAVDPGQAQAKEQLRLSVDYLRFVVERLECLTQRDRFELDHHLEMAEALRSVLAHRSATHLEAAIGAGQSVLLRPGAPASAVRGATSHLATAVSAAVRAAAALEAPVRREVERSVLHASGRRIAFERAWYLPLGLDPDPSEVKPLLEFLEGGT